MWKGAFVQPMRQKSLLTFGFKKNTWLLMFHYYLQFVFSFVFVNNFAFGPHVDHQLKLRFQSMKEGKASVYYIMI